MATNVLQHATIDPEFSLGYSPHTAISCFQEVLRSHPEVAALCGARLSIVRSRPRQGDRVGAEFLPAVSEAAASCARGGDRSFRPSALQLGEAWRAAAR